MKEKTIFRDAKGCMSMIRWFLFVLAILICLQFLSGIVISFLIVFRREPDFIPLAIALFSGIAIETFIGIFGKIISKKFEIEKEGKSE